MGKRTYKPCGTNAAYMRHKKNGEEPCEACCIARKAYMAPYRPKPKGPKPLMGCGTHAGYKRHIEQRTEPCEPCRAAKREYQNARWIPHPVEIQPCGTYGGYSRHRRYGTPVCEACAQAARDYGKQRRIANPEMVRRRTDRRRARQHGAFVEHIDRIAIFDRDHWTCQHCRRKLNPATRYPDKRTASLDHIIPLARGGKHEASNVQLLCLDCNRRKGARAANDQLRLIG